jgi:ribosomal protein L40E
VAQPLLVVPLQAHYRRDALMPLDGGPWLVPRPFAPGVLPVVALCWLVVFAALWHVPHPSAVLLGLWVGLLVCMGGVLGVASLYRQEIQVCPACLQANARGATRCRCCRFEG